MKRLPWVLIAVVVALVLLVPGGAIVAVQLVKAARGRREVFDQVSREVSRQLEELRPDLTADQRRRAGELLGGLAVHETGGGVTPAWLQGWNFGNVTAGASWTGSVVVAGDTEPDAAGNYVPIQARFRKYVDLAAAVSDWLTGVLLWKREREANVAGYLYAGDAAGFARALYAAGYYTAKPDGYAAAVAKNVASYGSGAA